MAEASHHILVRSERAKIASRVRRSLLREVVLILTFGTTALCVFYFVAHPIALTPLIVASGMALPFALLLLALVTAAVLAVLHVAFWRQRLREARLLQAELHRADELQRQAETRQKLDTFKAMAK